MRANTKVDPATAQAKGDGVRLGPGQQQRGKNDQSSGMKLGPCNFQQSEEVLSQREGIEW